VIVALKPLSPLKIKFVTLAKLSPEKVISPVEPRCSQSWETELSLGTGWAKAQSPPITEVAQQAMLIFLNTNRAVCANQVLEDRLFIESQRDWQTSKIICALSRLASKNWSP